MNQNQIIRQLQLLNEKVNNLAENGISSPLPSENLLLNQKITDLEALLNNAHVHITKLETTIKNNHKEGNDQFVKMNDVVLKLEKNTKNIENEYLKVNNDYEQMKKNYNELFEKVNGIILKLDQPP